MNTPLLLSYYESDSFDPYYNLGLEKHLFDNVKDNEVILYLWQNKKTIVCGRNQNVFKECNLTALKNAGGSVARRLSGGGAVFHDLGNLNFTFIARSQNYDLKKQLKVITEAVRSFGIDAKITGRNDITADGKKFSGNAFLKQKDTQYHHGTIMLSVNTEHLSDFLNVDREKLKSKGVDSVKSRVTNLTSFNKNLTVSLMKEALFAAFAEVYKEKPIKKGVPEQVKENADFFKNPDFLYGKKLEFTNTLEERYPWGNIQINLLVVSGKIVNGQVFSDSLDQDFILEFEKQLKGINYSAESLTILTKSITTNPEVISDLDLLFSSSI